MITLIVFLLTHPIVSLSVSTLLSLFSYGKVGMCCLNPSKASLMLCILLLSLMLAACLCCTCCTADLRFRLFPEFRPPPELRLCPGCFGSAAGGGGGGGGVAASSEVVDEQQGNGDPAGSEPEPEVPVLVPIPEVVECGDCCWLSKVETDSMKSWNICVSMNWPRSEVVEARIKLKYFVTIRFYWAVKKLRLLKNLGLIMDFEYASP